MSIASVFAIIFLICSLVLGGLVALYSLGILKGKTRNTGGNGSGGACCSDDTGDDTCTKFNKLISGLVNASSDPSSDLAQIQADVNARLGCWSCKTPPNFPTVSCVKDTCEDSNGLYESGSCQTPSDCVKNASTACGK